MRATCLLAYLHFTTLRASSTMRSSWLDPLGKRTNNADRESHTQYGSSIGQPRRFGKQVFTFSSRYVSRCGLFCFLSSPSEALQPAFGQGRGDHWRGRTVEAGIVSSLLSLDSLIMNLRRSWTKGSAKASDYLGTATPCVRSINIAANNWILQTCWVPNITKDQRLCGRHKWK